MYDSTAGGMFAIQLDLMENWCQARASEGTTYAEAREMLIHHAKPENLVNTLAALDMLWTSPR